MVKVLQKSITLRTRQAFHTQSITRCGPQTPNLSPWAICAPYAPHTHRCPLVASVEEDAVAGQQTSPFSFRHLVCAAGEHGSQGNNDFGYCECRAPAPIASVIEYVKANVTVAVNMGMDGRWWQKHHFWRLQRVIVSETHRNPVQIICVPTHLCQYVVTAPKGFAFVQGLRPFSGVGALHGYCPVHHVVTLQRLQRAALWWA